MGICGPVTRHSEVNVVITSIESNIDKYLLDLTLQKNLSRSNTNRLESPDGMLVVLVFEDQ